MVSVQSWSEAVGMSLIDLWDRFIGFFPSLLGAIIVFIAGWIIASILGRMVEKIVHVFKVNQAVEKSKFSGRVRDAGITMDPAKFFGGLVKWFLILVFLMAATDILRLNQVTGFLNSIILYLPNVVVATIILAIAFLVGNLVYNVIKGSTKLAGLMSAKVLAIMSKWAIIIFGILAALVQLGIAVSLVNTIFTGLIAMLAIAGGLAFGLGGKDEAAQILKKIREELTD